MARKNCLFARDENVCKLLVCFKFCFVGGKVSKTTFCSWTEDSVTQEEAISQAAIHRKARPSILSFRGEGVRTEQDITHHIYDVQRRLLWRILMCLYVVPSCPFFACHLRLFILLSCRYDSVTIMFSGIVGFAKYCAENSDAEGAMKIVTMLNELYTSFDELTDPSRNPNIYKVSEASRAEEGEPDRQRRYRRQSNYAPQGYNPLSRE